MERWEVICLNPVDMTTLWSLRGSSLKVIANKWNEEAGNDYISLNKLTRMSLGRSVNPFVRVNRLSSEKQI